MDKEIQKIIKKILNKKHYSYSENKWDNRENEEIPKIDNIKQIHFVEKTSDSYRFEIRNLRGWTMYRGIHDLYFEHDKDGNVEFWIIINGWDN